MDGKTGSIVLLLVLVVVNVILAAVMLSIGNWPVALINLGGAGFALFTAINIA